jgi:hypothetical protein
MVGHIGVEKDTFNLLVEQQANNLAVKKTAEVIQRAEAAIQQFVIDNLRSLSLHL